MSPHFIVYLVGAPQVGKTTYMTRLKTGEFITQYTPTKYSHTYKLEFNTTKGTVTFSVIEIPGNLSTNDLRFIERADGCMAMFDLERSTTFDYALKMCGEIYSLTDCKAIYCGNKYDTNEGKKNISRSYAHSISAKNNYNIIHPFLDLTRSLMKDDSLYFLPSITPSPEEYDDLPPLIDEEDIKKTFADELRGLVEQHNWFQKWKNMHLENIKKVCLDEASNGGQKCFIQIQYYDVPINISEEEYNETISSFFKKDYGFKNAQVNYDEIHGVDIISLEW